MMFRRKFERARKLQRERMAESGEDPRREEEPVPLEKGDRLALFLSAMVTLFLPAALVILGIAGVFLLILHFL